MTKALIILLAVALLVVLTAIRYRRQIVGLISFYRQVKAIRAGISVKGKDAILNDDRTGIRLLKCARCGKWIPKNESRDLGGQTVCSQACSSFAAA
jgi:hypothetical protein